MVGLYRRIDVRPQGQLSVRRHRLILSVSSYTAGMELLGPILFIRDSAWENQVWGLIFAIVLVSGMLSVFIKPRLWSALLAIFSVLGWLFLGMIGAGIDV
jgi:hypothetical protein